MRYLLVVFTFGTRHSFFSGFGSVKQIKFFLRQLTVKHPVFIIGSYNVRSFLIFSFINIFKIKADQPLTHDTLNAP